MNERHDSLQQRYDEVTERIDDVERDTPEFDVLHKEADRILQQMHDLKAACDHFAHFRTEREWTPESVPAGFKMTCLECGHTWQAPAPILEVEVSFKIEARATIDLARYFNGLHDSARKEYAEFEISEDGYYVEPWERPMAWLVNDDDDVAGGINVVPHRVFAERGQPQPIREDVDVDDIEARVRTRPGVRAYNQDWTEEDMETLRFHVPWLNKVHMLLDEEDGVDPEELARIPGPLDIPLAFETHATEPTSVLDLMEGE